MAITVTRRSVFDRIVCGLDGSPLAVEAVRQARILLSHEGRVELVGVFEPPLVGYLPYAAPLHVENVRDAWAQTYWDAVALCPEGRRVWLPDGMPARRLLDHVARTTATLVAVGAPRHHRAVGAVRGDVATSLLHRSPASVLIARPAINEKRFPRLVLVGYDGSPSAGSALDVAREIAERFDAELRVIAAGEEVVLGCADVDGITIERDAHAAVDALRDASREADLLVVGSRGLRGLAAVGSVSEQIGHDAFCSVLVVKDDARQREEVRDDAHLVRRLVPVGSHR
jgi:nucleotide-binding universal stress UspA family protein